MKCVDHCFVDRIYDKGIKVPNDRLGLWLSDYCINCNKTVEEIMNEIRLKIGKYNFVLSLQEQISFLNKNIKCITEDEYIIKGIIE